MNITSNQSEQFGQVGPSKNSQFIVVFGNLKHKLTSQNKVHELNDNLILDY
jgi:hypothetical protein